MLPKRCKIEYLPAAESDVAEILTYVTVNLAAPQAAAALLKKMNQAVKLLETFPYAHPVYRPTDFNGAQFEFRAMVVDAYLVFYYVTGDTVNIARVLYGKRDVRNVLF